MTERDVDRDEGGEAPCMAHLFSEPEQLTDSDFAQLARGLADGLVIADGEGTIAFWNDAATRIFGWSATEAVGESLDLIIPERLRDRHWTGYQRVMATGETHYGDTLLEVPALHHDGRPLSIAFTVTLLRHPGSDGPFAIAALLRDDTERWQERRELRRRLAELEGDGSAGAPLP
jgi:PAS domain S-box-containing protein